MNSTYYKETWSMLRELTIRAVESMPADKMDFKPENSRSFGEIALHLVSSSYFFTNKISGREDKPEKELTLANFPTRDAIVQALKDDQRRTAEIVGKLTREDLDRIIPLMRGDGPLETFLSIMCFHESDHKGNLVIMAKMHGGNPPDVMRFMQEAATRA